MASRDVFPLTQRTWIDEHLNDKARGRLEVNNHVMRVYHEPLKVYFQGTSDRWLGEPDDIVQGFFADRLSREDFFHDWRDAEMPLRRWLMNAFCFYLKEQRRRQKRDARGVALEFEPEAYSTTPQRVIDQSFIASLIQRAIEVTSEQCAADGIEQHWQVFAEHYCRGRGYPQIAEEFGLSPARAAVMARTAGRRFRGVLRDMVRRDAHSTRAEGDGIDEEIQRLLATLD